MASITALILLLGAGALGPWMALERLKMTNGRLPLMDAANESRIRVISYIDQHSWVVMSYAVMFAAALPGIYWQNAPI